MKQLIGITMFVGVIKSILTNKRRVLCSKNECLDRNFGKRCVWAFFHQRHCKCSYAGLQQNTVIPEIEKPQKCVLAARWCPTLFLAQGSHFFSEIYSVDWSPQINLVTPPRSSDLTPSDFSMQGYNQRVLTARHPVVFCK